MNVGSGLDSNNFIGPVVSSEQKAMITKYLELGKNEGLEVSTGGHAMNRKGHFIEPTIFSNVSNSSPIAREEIFGPVLAVIPFEDADDAMSIANDSPYGLSAAVWTKDFSRAHRMAAGLKSGTVWINGFHMYDERLPFGGYKNSGVGRDLGEAALDGYTEMKTVVANL